jgi:hypothetical protein
MNLISSNLSQTEPRLTELSAKVALNIVMYHNIFIIAIAYNLFWFSLHFGITFLYSRLPKNLRLRLFNYKKRLFIVSEKEMRIYKKIHLHKWKDILPQFNKDFNKRNLPNKISKEYLESFINVTCKAEAIHYTIIPLGYLSVFFALLGNQQIWLIIFMPTFIGICNVPFALIQRYNRFRLVRLLIKKY